MQLCRRACRHWGTADRHSAPSPNILSGSQAPHQRHELPWAPCRCPRLLLCSITVAPRRSVCAAMEPPAPVSPFLPEPPNQSHASPPTSSHYHRPPHHRLLPESSGAAGTVRQGARLPCTQPQAKRPKWARPTWPSRPNPAVDRANYYSDLFYLPFRLFKLISK
jgi:hypothetical protein